VAGKTIRQSGETSNLRIAKLKCDNLLSKIRKAAVASAKFTAVASIGRYQNGALRDARLPGSHD
jgi:hypothetical protein